MGRGLQIVRSIGDRSRRLRVEQLEDRWMLSVSVELASKSLDGEAAGSYSTVDDTYAATVSANGRYVVFRSNASNLVDGINVPTGSRNIYRYDRETGDVLLVSVSVDGTSAGNGGCQEPSISADGNVVTFNSNATNLHPYKSLSSTNDVFARDIAAGVTHLVSARQSGWAGGAAGKPIVSADGSSVAFLSFSSDLHPLDPDSSKDLFVRDLVTGVTHLVTVNSAGTGTGNDDGYELSQFAISADGTVVAFSSESSNLHSLDTDTDQDVFARNIVTGTTHLVSVNEVGTESGNGVSRLPRMSADGNIIGFVSSANDLESIDQDAGTHEGYVDIFVRNLATGVTQLVNINAAGTSSSNGVSYISAISADGNVVAYESTSDDLVDFGEPTAPWHLFARSLATATTYLVSFNASGTGYASGEAGFDPVLSADGSIVVFDSEYSDIHPLDTSDGADIAVRNLLTGTTVLVSVNAAGTSSGNGASKAPSISADGSVIAFGSKANDLVDSDFNFGEDAFVAVIAWNAPALPGDYNDDLSVDAADYVLWRKLAGTSGYSSYELADGSGDGAIDDEDYGVWEGDFGSALSIGGAGSVESSAGVYEDDAGARSDMRPLLLVPGVTDVVAANVVGLVEWRSTLRGNRHEVGKLVGRAPTVFEASAPARRDAVWRYWEMETRRDWNEDAEFFDVDGSLGGNRDHVTAVEELFSEWRLR